MPRSRRKKSSPAESEAAAAPAPEAPEAPPEPAPAPEPPPPPPVEQAPPAGPAYGVSFGLVWRAALEAIRESDRWSVVESDPVRGEIAAEIRPLLRGAPRPAHVVVSLDDLGLTRVEAWLQGERDRGVAPSRQIAGFYRRLERLLARGP